MNQTFESQLLRVTHLLDDEYSQIQGQSIIFKFYIQHPI